MVTWTVHGILQVRILEWVAIPFSRGFSQPSDQTQVSCIAGGFLTSWVTREAQEYWSGKISSKPSPLCGWKTVTVQYPSRTGPQKYIDSRAHSLGRDLALGHHKCPHNPSRIMEDSSQEISFPVITAITFIESSQYAKWHMMHWALVPTSDHGLPFSAPTAELWVILWSATTTGLWSDVFPPFLGNPCSLSHLLVAGVEISGPRGRWAPRWKEPGSLRDCGGGGCERLSPGWTLRVAAATYSA